MSCPIKDEDGEIDHQSLADLTEIGGHLLEIGNRRYSAWKEAMRGAVGDVFNEADLHTIYANVRAEAKDRTDVEQSPMTAEHNFIMELSKRYGTRPAADFLNGLVDGHGSTELLGKMMSGTPLSDAERATILHAKQAYLSKEKPTPGTTTVAMKVLKDVTAQHQADMLVAKVRSGQVSKTRSVATRAAASADDILDSHIARRIGAKNVPAFRSALTDTDGGSTILSKIASGDGDLLTSAEKAKFGAAYRQFNTGRTLGVQTPTSQLISDIVKETAVAKNKMSEAAVKTPADILTTHIARRIGSNNVPGLRNALKDSTGAETIFNKIADGKADTLTESEKSQFTQAYRQFNTGRRVGIQTPISKVLSDLTHDTNATRKQAAVKTPTIKPIPTETDHVLSTIKGRIATGRIDDLRKAITDTDGKETILTKLSKGQALSEDETARFTSAMAQMRRPASVAGRVTLGQSQVRSIMDDFNKANAANKPKSPVVPKTNVEQLHSILARRIGGKNVDGLRDALKDGDGNETIFNKIANGQESTLTDAEKSHFTHTYKEFNTAHTGGTQTPMSKVISDLSKDTASTKRMTPTRAPRPPLPEASPTDMLASHFARRIGTKKTGVLRNALRDGDGSETIFNKIAHTGGDSLTQAEKDRFGSAYQAASPTRVKGVPSGLSQDLTDLIKETKDKAKSEALEHQLQQFSGAKQYVLDQLSKTMKPEHLASVDKALAQLKPGNTAGLSEIWQRGRNKTFSENAGHVIRSSFLSNPKTIGSIAGSHVLLHAVEEGPVRALASIGGVVPKISGKATASELKAFVTKGIPQGLHVLAHGENSLVLSGKSPIHNVDRPLTSEFTLGHVGQKGLGGALTTAANATVRLPMRMHSSYLHALGIGMYDRGLTEAATMHVDALEKTRGAKFTSAERNAQIQQLHDHPSKAIHDAATLYAKEQLLSNKSALGTALGKIDDKSSQSLHLVKNAVMPFNNIPTNIAGRSLDYTGIGSVQRLFERATAPEFKNGGKWTAAQRADFDRSVARGVTGAGLGVAGYELAKHGIVNAPDEKKGEYGSINAFGHKIDIDRLAPIANPLLAGAAVRDYQNRAKIGAAGSPDSEIWKGAMRYVAENPLNRLSQTYQDLASGDPKTFQRAAGNFVGGMVPSGIGQLASSTDPTHAMRQKNSTLDYVKNRIPGLRETLPLKLDINGRPAPDGSSSLFPLRSVPIHPQTHAELLQQQLSVVKQQLANLPPGTRSPESRRLYIMSRILGRQLRPYYNAEHQSPPPPGYGLTNPGQNTFNPR